MKRLFSFAFSLVAFAVVALAQTPQEIVSRMEKEMEKHEKDGVSMIVDVKIPILGTMSTKTWMLDDYYRLEVSMMGADIITWSDGTDDWVYNSKDNKVEISKSAVKEAKDKAAKTNDTAGDLDLFSEITAGYDVSINKETENAWYLQCKKNKANTEKDAPKTIDLVIAKGTYYPVSLSTKVSGITMTMRDLKFGVSKQKVTFHAEDFPGVKIIDKR